MGVCVYCAVLLSRLGFRRACVKSFGALEGLPTQRLIPACGGEIGEIAGGRAGPEQSNPGT